MAAVCGGNAEASRYNPETSSASLLATWVAWSKFCQLMTTTNARSTAYRTPITAMMNPATSLCRSSVESSTLWRTSISPPIDNPTATTNANTASNAVGTSTSRNFSMKFTIVALTAVGLLTYQTRLMYLEAGCMVEPDGDDRRSARG